MGKRQDMLVAIDKLVWAEPPTAPRWTAHCDLIWESGYVAAMNAVLDVLEGTE